MTQPDPTVTPTPPAVPDPPAPVAPVVPDPPAPPDPTPDPPEPWTHALPEGVRTFAELKGWKGAEEAIRSYQSLEQLHGVAEDRLVKLPGDPEDAEAWNEVYTKLGRPADAAGYELVKPDLPDGSPDLTDWFAEQAFAAGIPKQKGQAIVANYQAKMAELAADVAQRKAQTSEVEKQAVLREWGTESDANVQAAKEFAGRMKWDSDLVGKLEDALGTRRLMETLALLGRATSESTFVPPDFESDQGFGLTPAAASAEITRLKGDKQYMDAYLAGDKDAVARMTQLQQLAAPELAG